MCEGGLGRLKAKACPGFQKSWLSTLLLSTAGVKPGSNKGR